MNEDVWLTGEPPKTDSYAVLWYKGISPAIGYFYAEDHEWNNQYGKRTGSPYRWAHLNLPDLPEPEKPRLQRVCERLEIEGHYQAPDMWDEIISGYHTDLHDALLWRIERRLTLSGCDVSWCAHGGVHECTLELASVRYVGIDSDSPSRAMLDVAEQLMEADGRTGGAR